MRITGSLDVLRGSNEHARIRICVLVILYHVVRFHREFHVVQMQKITVFDDGGLFSVDSNRGGPNDAMVIHVDKHIRLTKSVQIPPC